MKIVWDGMIGGAGSLGIVGLQTCRALRATGCEVEVTVWSGSEANVLAEFPVYKGGEAEVVIRFCDPWSVECLEAFPRCQRKIAYCYFDFGVMDDARATLINRGRWELWAVSPFTRQMLLNAGVRIPMEVIPHGVEAREVPTRGKPTEPLTFVYVAQLGGPRKGTDILVDAFRAAFRDRADVRLVLKDAPGTPFHFEDANIELISGDLPQAALLELLAQAHYFVAPARMESFGLLGLEVASVGTPLIYPWHSAYATYANDMPGALPLLLGEWREGRDGERTALHWENSVEELTGLLEWVAATRFHATIVPERVWRYAMGWTWARTAGRIRDVLEC